MNRSFVRIGKWFVKPYEKDEKPINKRYVERERALPLGFHPYCLWLMSMSRTFKMPIFMFIYRIVGILDMICVLKYICMFLQPGPFTTTKMHVWSVLSSMAAQHKIYSF